MDKRRCTACGKQFAFDRKHRLVSCPRCSAVQFTSDVPQLRSSRPGGPPFRPTSVRSANPTPDTAPLSAAVLWSIIGSLSLALILIIAVVLIISSRADSDRVAVESNSADTNSKSDAATVGQSAEAPESREPVPAPNPQSGANSIQSFSEASASLNTEPRDNDSPVNSRLELINTRIESGKISPSEMMELAETPIDGPYHDAISRALHTYAGSGKTMDDPTTLAVIRWSNGETARVLRNKMGAGKRIDVAFFYALVCVGSDRTLDDLSSLEMVAKADYPILQTGQPEWVLRPDQYNARPECLKLEKFFTDYLLESHHYPVRKMGLYGCLMCGRGYCLSRVGDMSQDDTAPDVKDMARKVWEEISNRKAND